MMTQIAKTITQKTCLGLILGTAIVCLASIGVAQENGAIATKTLIGKVLSLSPIAAPQFIGISPATGNTDYYFHIDAAVEVVNKKSLQEIKVGDMVEVTYDAVTKTIDRNKNISNQTVKIIKFLQPAITGLRSEE
jgi:hypothetical protein